MNAISFNCPSCDVETGCTIAYIEDGKLYFEGKCGSCGHSVKFSLDAVLVHLSEKMARPSIHERN